MRKYKYSHLFRKQLKKIKGKQLQNILNKRDDILKSDDLGHYKNLTKSLKKYKRVHVNNSTSVQGGMIISSIMARVQLIKYLNLYNICH